jgi:hypothetical protein
MFKKTIAVLLIFSIALSSCGKKDKDKSNDFLRTAPVESPPSNVPLIVEGGRTYSVYCDKNQQQFLDSLVKDSRVKVNKDFEEDIDCVLSLLNCPVSSSSSSSSRCSASQIDCFAPYSHVALGARAISSELSFHYTNPDYVPKTKTERLDYLDCFRALKKNPNAEPMVCGNSSRLAEVKLLREHPLFEATMRMLDVKREVHEKSVKTRIDSITWIGTTSIAATLHIFNEFVLKTWRADVLRDLGPDNNLGVGAVGHSVTALAMLLFVTAVHYYGVPRIIRRFF